MHVHDLIDVALAAGAECAQLGVPDEILLLWLQGRLEARVVGVSGDGRRRLVCAGLGGTEAPGSEELHGALGGPLGVGLAGKCQALRGGQTTGVSLDGRGRQFDAELGLAEREGHGTGGVGVEEHDALAGHLPNLRDTRDTAVGVFNVVVQLSISLAGRVVEEKLARLLVEVEVALVIPRDVFAEDHVVVLSPAKGDQVRRLLDGLVHADTQAQLMRGAGESASAVAVCGVQDHVGGQRAAVGDEVEDGARRSRHGFRFIETMLEAP